MKKSTLLVSLLLFTSILQAQNKNPKYEAYIEKYADLAVASQKEYHIPASITLAQGLLESAAGESRLAQKCNNHFGIKCGDSWYGKTMHQDDDARGECFRCYNNVKSSFDDHAKFLQRQRYSFLFDYAITDYKSWAKGLRQAGYATDPKYPDKLIKIIEDYELYRFDDGKQTVSSAKNQNPDIEHLADIASDGDQLFGYTEIKNNGVRCYQLATDDTFKNISKHTGIPVVELLYFNDLPHKTDLYRGDMVYLQPKKNKVNNKLPKAYIVKAGDSMHSISQEFGIKLKALYKLNKIKYGTPAEAGQQLKLR